jgi:hypothetical protein
MSGHAPLPPSSAHLWHQCHGWRRMQEQIEPLPEDDSRAAEGTAAHWAVSEVLSGRQVDVGIIAPNGVALDLEMCEGADLMDDAVGPERSSLRVESAVHCAYVHPTDNWGTPDAWRLHGGYLDVWDYKYGHRHVAAVGNWQLVNYAAAVVMLLRLQQADAAGIRVRMHIVQPRGYHGGGPVRTWEVSVTELTDLARELMVSARANDPACSSPCTPHLDCRDCKARHACEALQAASLRDAEEAYPPLPLVLSDTALVRQRRVLAAGIELMKARLSGLDDQATAILKAGRPLEGLALESSPGRLTWSKPVSEVIALGVMCGVDLGKPSAITPTQAIKAGLPTDLVAEYATRPAGHLRLVEDDGSAARAAFKEAP